MQLYSRFLTSYFFSTWFNAQFCAMGKKKRGKKKEEKESWRFDSLLLSLYLSLDLPLPRATERGCRISGQISTGPRARKKLALAIRTSPAT